MSAFKLDVRKRIEDFVASAKLRGKKIKAIWLGRKELEQYDESLSRTFRIKLVGADEAPTHLRAIGFMTEDGMIDLKASGKYRDFTVEYENV